MREITGNVSNWTNEVEVKYIQNNAEEPTATNKFNRTFFGDSFDPQNKLVDYTGKILEKDKRTTEQKVWTMLEKEPVNCKYKED